MKKDLICPVYIVLIVTAYLTAESQGTNPSVNLTVEGRGSLVGEQCPGTVKISCDGVDLSILRWRFNGSTDVVTFFSDSVAPSPFTNNPAFLNAELLSTAPDPLDPSFANFSSELVVDVSKLETESVTSITCGDPDTFEVIQVDVEIIHQTEPESPNGTNVIALYEFGSVTDVIVSWEKPETSCAEFQISLAYQVTLLGSSVVAVNHTSCGEVCIVSFQNFSDDSEEYRVSLYAVNDIGTSEVVEYPTSIVKQSSFYFTPTFLSNDCLFTCECFSNASLDTNSCSVLYTTDSMYMDPSTLIVSPLNTRFEITGTISDIIYYFEFSVSVNETLLVRNRLTEQAISSPRLGVLVIVFLTLTILAIILEAVLGTVVCVLKELNGFPANILFFGACLLGTLSCIFLFVFSIITGVQEDTCSLDWSRARDALIISAFILALFGIVFLTCYLLVSKKSGKRDLPAHSQGDEPINDQTADLRVELVKQTRENLQSNEKDSSSDAISSRQTGATVESHREENTTCLSEEVKNKDGEQDSSQTKITSAKKYTVYKVVARLEGRSYFLFRRYSEFKCLYDEIKKMYSPPETLLKLPGKRYVFSDFDPDFIKDCRVGLHEFLTNLMKIPKILESHLVREFLAMDDQRFALPIYEYETIDEPADRGKVAKSDRVELGDKRNTKAKITDFKLLKVIGKGTFRKVYFGQHKETRTLNAIKVLETKEIIEVEHIVAKRNVTNHPFLVGLNYSFQTSTKLYFVLDYVNGGKLLFHLQRQRVFDKPRATFYAAEITSALGYLHKLNIIYWDLKLENILLDASGHIILTDFGLCKENLGDTTKLFCGTPECPAPEVLLKQECSYSVDWWCLGVVTYEMMYGLPPFYSQKVAQMHDNILCKPLQLHSHITSSAQNLLKGLLQKDKAARLGSRIDDDEEIKAHPFFRSINWDDLLYKRLEPPFNPPANDAHELQHFDPEFKTVVFFDAPSSPIEVDDYVSVAKNTFDVFSYIPHYRK